ncbi:hypothetical protein JKP88DRAFT_261921 [Tribonema minus]|uniref:CST complex subunit CTC1 n=1 Tax=Tribonema minus TaxID=303371 RepID=A0A835ZF07_9STRA|nr:hypothetical protein JKP88DRAFT_261921 [Tribonema minus]
MFTIVIPAALQDEAQLVVRLLLKPGTPAAWLDQQVDIVAWVLVKPAGRQRSTWLSCLEVHSVQLVAAAAGEAGLGGSESLQGKQQQQQQCAEAAEGAQDLRQLRAGKRQKCCHVTARVAAKSPLLSTSGTRFFMAELGKHSVQNCYTSCPDGSGGGELRASLLVSRADALAWHAFLRQGRAYAFPALQTGEGRAYAFAALQTGKVSAQSAISMQRARVESAAEHGALRTRSRCQRVNGCYGRVCVRLVAALQIGEPGFAGAARADPVTGRTLRCCDRTRTARSGAALTLASLSIVVHCPLRARYCPPLADWHERQAGAGAVCGKQGRAEGVRGARRRRADGGFVPLVVLMCFRSGDGGRSSSLADTVTTPWSGSEHTSSAMQTHSTHPSGSASSSGGAGEGARVSYLAAALSAPPDAVHYAGVITHTRVLGIEGLYRLDDSFKSDVLLPPPACDAAPPAQLFMQLYPCATLGAGLRVGAAVLIQNVHPVRLWGKLEGFGACLRTSYEASALHQRRLHAMRRCSAMRTRVDANAIAGRLSPDYPLTRVICIQHSCQKRSQCFVALGADSHITSWQQPATRTLSSLVYPINSCHRSLLRVNKQVQSFSPKPPADAPYAPLYFNKGESSLQRVAWRYRLRAALGAKLAPALRSQGAARTQLEAWLLDVAALNCSTTAAAAPSCCSGAARGRCGSSSSGGPTAAGAGRGGGGSGEPTAAGAGRGGSGSGGACACGGGASSCVAASGVRPAGSTQNGSSTGSGSRRGGAGATSGGGGGGGGGGARKRNVYDEFLSHGADTCPAASAGTAAAAEHCGCADAERCCCAATERCCLHSSVNLAAPQWAAARPSLRSGSSGGGGDGVNWPVLPTLAQLLVLARVRALAALDDDEHQQGRGAGRGVAPGVASVRTPLSQLFAHPCAALGWLSVTPLGGGGARAAQLWLHDATASVQVLLLSAAGAALEIRSDDCGGRQSGAVAVTRGVHPAFFCKCGMCAFEEEDVCSGVKCSLSSGHAAADWRTYDKHKSFTARCHRPSRAAAAGADACNCACAHPMLSAAVHDPLSRDASRIGTLSAACRHRAPDAPSAACVCCCLDALDVVTEMVLLRGGGGGGGDSAAAAAEVDGVRQYVVTSLSSLEQCPVPDARPAATAAAAAAAAAAPTLAATAGGAAHGRNGSAHHRTAGDGGSDRPSAAAAHMHSSAQHFNDSAPQQQSDVAQHNGDAASISSSARGDDDAVISVRAALRARADASGEARLAPPHARESVAVRGLLHSVAFRNKLPSAARAQARGSGGGAHEAAAAAGGQVRVMRRRRSTCLLSKNQLHEEYKRNDKRAALSEPVHDAMAGRQLCLKLTGLASPDVVSVYLDAVPSCWPAGMVPGVSVVEVRGLCRRLANKWRNMYLVSSSESGAACASTVRVVHLCTPAPPAGRVAHDWQHLPPAKCPCCSLLLRVCLVQVQIASLTHPSPLVPSRVLTDAAGDGDAQLRAYTRIADLVAPHALDYSLHRVCVTVSSVDSVKVAKVNGKADSRPCAAIQRLRDRVVDSVKPFGARSFGSSGSGAAAVAKWEAIGTVQDGTGRAHVLVDGPCVVELLRLTPAQRQGQGLGGGHCVERCCRSCRSWRQWQRQRRRRRGDGRTGGRGALWRVRPQAGDELHARAHAVARWLQASMHLKVYRDSDVQDVCCRHGVGNRLVLLNIHEDMSMTAVLSVQRSQRAQSTPILTSRVRVRRRVHGECWRDTVDTGQAKLSVFAHPKLFLKVLALEDMDVPASQHARRETNRILDRLRSQLQEAADDSGAATKKQKTWWKWM